HTLIIASLGTHRFRRAVFGGRRIDWNQMRRNTNRLQALGGPPNILRSTPARWKRCVPRRLLIYAQNPGGRLLSTLNGQNHFGVSLASRQRGERLDRVSQREGL